MYGDPYAYYSNGIVNPAYGYGTPTYGNNVPVGYVPTIATVTTYIFFRFLNLFLLVF